MKYFLAHAVSISTLALSIPATADVDVKHEPTRIGAWVDAGQVIKGEVDNKVAVDMQVLTRSKVALTQQTTINERLTLTGGIGGLFFYSLPNDPSGPHTRTTKFAAQLEEASTYYRAGDLENPTFDTKFGLFFVKYNPDAKNLGEYLFRSGTYPGYLQTGGWYILNNAGYFMQGARVGWHTLGGALNLDGFLFMERDIEPIFDLTPALMLSWTPPKGAFHAGVGLAYNHLIPAKPSDVKPRKPMSAYRKTPTGKDTLLSFDESQKNIDSLPGIDFYTFQGIKVVARASFNPQAVIQTDLLGPEDLKLYTEFAVLGVKNYPIYYENIAKRIPIMFGFNLPTFKLVDKASFELEYYNSDFPNSVEEVYWRTNPVPGGIGGINTPERQAYIDSLGTQRKMRDKVKWSFWLQKDLGAGLGLTLQVASDHFRPVNFNLEPAHEPITQNWNHWYYLFRLSFGI